MINKKILIFSHEFPPLGGGAGVVANQFAVELTEIGYDVSVLCRYQETKKCKFKIIHNHNSSKLWFYGYKNILDYNQFDLIFLNDPSAIYCAGLFFTKSQLQKSICFLHGSEPERVYETSTFLRKISFFKYYFTKSLNSCSLIFTPSKFMKKKFLDQSNLFNLKEKITVLNYGVDNKIFYKKQKNKDINTLVFISVSRIEEKKGYKRKFYIFENLIKKYKIQNIRWKIVGDGRYLNELTTLVKNNNMEEYIEFVGKIDRSKLVDYYNESDIFWLLSDYEESLGLVYIEAQMSGLLAIGNNNAGVKEAISNKKSGFLINSDDEIYNIILNRLYLDIKEKEIVDFMKSFKLREQVFELIKLVEKN